MIVIGFSAPVIGVDGEFNTIRLGMFFYKKLSIGDSVLLMNEKEREAFGVAQVTQVICSGIGELCLLYGHQNHTQLDLDQEGAAQRLYQALMRIYGPHKMKPESKGTAIFLKRTE